MDTPNETTEPVVNDPVVDTEAAKSRTKAFFARHKPKLVTTGIAVLGVVSFAAGRASKDVVEDVEVDVDVKYAGDDSDSSES